MITVGIVGAGTRVKNVYGPLLRTLSSQFKVVGLTSRSAERGSQVAAAIEAPYYSNLEGLLTEAKPDLLVVSVSYSLNGPVARTAIESGLPCLLETPAAVHAADIKELSAISQRLGNPVVIAEQYPQRPMERLKRLLIEAGVFGSIRSAANDFMGHDYHGFALIRSYIGPDILPAAIWGWRQTQPVADHFSSTSQKMEQGFQEEWWRALIEFENGSVGRFDFSSLSYGSALRWERSTRFYGTQGMARGDELTLLDAAGVRCAPISIERRIQNVGGMEGLDALVATVGRQRIAWENPFHQVYLDDEAIAVANCLKSLTDAMSGGQTPEYGLDQAYVDQVLVEGMHQSANAESSKTPLTFESARP